MFLKKDPQGTGWLNPKFLEDLPSSSLKCSSSLRLVSGSSCLSTANRCSRIRRQRIFSSPASFRIFVSHSAMTKPHFGHFPSLLAFPIFSSYSQKGQTNETVESVLVFCSSPQSALSLSLDWRLIRRRILNSAEVFGRYRLLDIRQDRGWMHCGVTRI